MIAGLAGRAEAACAEGRCVEAIEALEESIRRRPASLSAYYALGMCYAGGCRVHEWVHPGIAARYLEQALKLLGSRSGPARASILDALGNALAQVADPSGDSLRRAIAHQREAAEIYRDNAREDDWTRLEFNIGNSLCDLSELTGEDHWREAVINYESALRVRTREKDPVRYAAILENLGTAYRRVAGAENIRRSIACYHHALWIYTASTHPARHAALENNLGNAFLSLPAPDGRAAARNAVRALRHLDRALAWRSRDQRSREYGITQYNRAQACFRACPADPVAGVRSLEAAYEAFRAVGDACYEQLVANQLENIRRRP